MYATKKFNLKDEEKDELHEIYNEGVRFVATEEDGELKFYDEFSREKAVINTPAEFTVKMLVHILQSDSKTNFDEFSIKELIDRFC